MKDAVSIMRVFHKFGADKESTTIKKDNPNDIGWAGGHIPGGSEDSSTLGVRYHEVGSRVEMEKVLSIWYAKDGWLPSPLH